MDILIYLILGFYGLVLFISPIILIAKIIERKKEKKKENLDKYKKY